MASDYHDVLAAAALMSGRSEESILEELVMEKYGKAFATLEGMRKKRDPEPELPLPPAPKATKPTPISPFYEEWGRVIPREVAAMCKRCARQIKVGETYRRKNSKGPDHVAEVIEVGTYHVKLRQVGSPSGKRKFTISRANGFVVPANPHQNQFLYTKEES